MSERFLGEEDLDLVNPSWKELLAWWDLWLRQTQATNEFDEHLYSQRRLRRRAGLVQTARGFERVDAVREPPS